jgi:hypothetical protein
MVQGDTNIMPIIKYDWTQTVFYVSIPTTEDYKYQTRRKIESAAYSKGLKIKAKKINDKIRVTVL